MKSYNGFSGEERLKTYRWMRAEQKAGRRPMPDLSHCTACYETRGYIMEHSEDYSSPVLSGDHHGDGERVGEHALCWRCHMMLHSRFSYPEGFQRYLDDLAAGAVFEPCFDNKGYFREILGYMHGRVRPVYWNDPRGSTILHKIAKGLDPAGPNRFVPLQVSLDLRRQSS